MNRILPVFLAFALGLVIGRQSNRSVVRFAPSNSVVREKTAVLRSPTGQVSLKAQESLPPNVVGTPALDPAALLENLEIGEVRVACDSATANFFRKFVDPHFKRVGVGAQSSAQAEELTRLGSRLLKKNPNWCGQGRLYAGQEVATLDAVLDLASFRPTPDETCRDEDGRIVAISQNNSCFHASIRLKFQGRDFSLEHSSCLDPIGYLNDAPYLTLELYRDWPELGQHFPLILIPLPEGGSLEYLARGDSNWSQSNDFRWRTSSAIDVPPESSN